MPTAWSSFVRHECSYHCVDTLESCGPFPACNMLEPERFHTLLKSLARSKKDLFASVVNNYELLEMSLLPRLDESDEAPQLTLPPRRSTLAGFVSRPDSSRRAEGELAMSLKGPLRSFRLTDADLQLTQNLWRITDQEYDALWTRFERHNRSVAVANKIANIKDIPDRWDLSDKQRKFRDMSRIAKVRASFLSTVRTSLVRCVLVKYGVLCCVVACRACRVRWTQPPHRCFGGNKFAQGQFHPDGLPCSAWEPVSAHGQLWSNQKAVFSLPVPRRPEQHCPRCGLVR
jgi:hypothetical protein